MKPRRQAQRIPRQRRGRRQAGPPPGARRMACAALLSCAAMLAACGGGGGSSTAPPGMMPPEMMPPAAQAALTVMAGGSASGGGSVSVAVGSGVAGVVGAGASSSVTAAGDTVTLTATAADGYAFAGWTLSGGLACADGPAGNPCTLAAGSLSADATATAAFAAALSTLTVTAGPGGSVSAEVAGAAAATVGAGSSQGFAVSVLSATTTLTAVAADGYESAGWTLSLDGLACADGTAAHVCALPAGSLTADATATAAFVDLSTLTVTAGDGGSVSAEVAGAAAATVGAGSPQGFAVSVLSAATTLTAVASAGYESAGWTLSLDSLACAGGTAAHVCALPAGSLTADVTATAAFVDLSTLTVTAGDGGSVSAEVAGAAAVTVGAGSSQGFAVSVLSAATTLTAVASAGYESAGWTLSLDSLACAGGTAAHVCALPAGSLTADATATATFVALSALTVTTGPGGSVSAEVAGAAAVTVGAGSSQGFAVSVLSAATTLTAVAAAGHESAGWTLSLDSLACAGGTATEVCALPAGSLTADVTATAAFAAALSTLTVTAGPGGSVSAEVAGAAAVTVATGSSRGFAVSVLSAATTLTAVAVDGYESAGWTLSLDSLACAGGTATHVCALPAGSLTAATTATAAFVALSTLTVTAGDSGSVAVTVGGGAAGSVTAGNSTDVAVTVAVAVALAAMPDGNDARFVGWALSDGLACRDGPQASPCMLAPVGADGSATAEFLPLPDAVTWIGPGAVEENSLALTAVPYADGAFEEWRGGPCDGSTVLACARPDSGSGYPVAVFRPFVAAGIKSLAFGLGYQGESPHSFRVSLRRDVGAGYEAPPALDALPGSGQASASLAAPVHLLPWGRGGYLTEVCDVASNCVAADGGERALAQAVSRAVTGYFKAPVAVKHENFGLSVALSADGATLAVGTPLEDSSHTGTFAPGDAGYQAALDSTGTFKSGAVTVYRRTGAAWNVEAFVKAPVAGAKDEFGTSVALSANGATLAVGTPLEDSSHTGTFAPVDVGYQAALDSDSDDDDDSGAAYVYRRSDAGRWAIEAFVKAPVRGDNDRFGFALALSTDGDTLAVGAPDEGSSHAGVFAPGDAGYQAALASNGVSQAGAAYVYRSTESGTWGIEAFVKAPKPGDSDNFGAALALSGDGATLAVGAPDEGSSHAGVFAPGDADYQTALDSNGTGKSGAVTVYRSTESGTWGVEAFVKAPKPGNLDNFGAALALSAGGATLAVGATGEDSSRAGAFAPGDAGYQAALDSNGTSGSGAATVYRRSGAGRWAVEAFIKAPNPGEKYVFGLSLDLSSNGVVMAVGSSGEDSSFSGVFVPEGEDYQDALDSDALDSGDGEGGAGAAYVYRRSNAGRWALEAFVKAPNTGKDDDFGAALALSGDGAMLAVSAPEEGGAALDQPVDGGHIPDSGGVRDSGAVYLY